MGSSVVHLWSPGFHGATGGIQMYSTYLLRAMRELRPSLEVFTFSKNEIDLPADVRFGSKRSCPFGHLSPAWRSYIFGGSVLYHALKQRPTLIVSTHLNFGPAARIAKSLAGTHYWLIAHGVDAWGLKGKWQVDALRNADVVLSVSEFTRNKLREEQALPDEILKLLPNTSDNHRFQIRPRPEDLIERHGIPSDHKILLTVSRLSSNDGYKGYDQVIRALPSVLECFPKLHYVVVGEGDDRPRIEQLIRELRLEPVVTLAGFIPAGELPKYYNLCDVFIMPSWGEGFGIVFLEAMLSGKPSIGGDRDGARDALLNGDGGILVDPMSVTAISEAVQSLLFGTVSFEAEDLRTLAIEHYGFERFKERLDLLLKSETI